MVGGGGGRGSDQKNDFWGVGGWVGGRYEDFVYIGGGSQNWISFWGHFYAIFGPFLSSMYRKKNLMGIVLGLLKFQFYLSFYF